MDVIKATIVKRGLTQAAVANALGISRTALWQKLSGKRAFTVNEAFALCDLLNLSVEVFRP